MRRAVGAFVLAGCGRIGFGASAAPIADAPADLAGDATVPFVESSGALDPAFGTAGVLTVQMAGADVRPFDLVARAGGGYLATGTHGSGGSSSMGLFALTAGGALDPTFAPGGIRDVGLTGNDFGYALARLGTKLVIVGDGDDNSSSTNDDVTLAMVDAGGALDASFGAAGFARFDLRGQMRADTSTSAVVDGGDLIVCGAQGYDLTDSHVALLRVDPTGALVPSFGTGGEVIDDFGTNVNDECSAALAIGGRVIAVGRTDQVALIAGYDPATGARDPTFASGTFGTDFAELYGVGTFGGDILAVGETNGSSLLVRLAPDGTPRASFGATGVASFPQIDVLFAVAEQPNDKVIVVGERNLNGVIARVLANGALDPTFGTAGVVTIPGSSQVELQGVTIEPGGRILVVGTRSNTTPRAGLFIRLI